MIAAFPCGKCGRQIIHLGAIGDEQTCVCGSVFWAMNAASNGVPGVTILMGRPVECDRYDSRCHYCGEPVGLTSYPAFALFRTIRCNGWHVVDLVGQVCPACSAPLPVESDDALTPIWREMAQA